MRTRVKICGITNIEDAQIATDAGADALGFNMFEGSVRFVAAKKARELILQLPAFVSSVGLFVNESAEHIKVLCDSVKFDLLQFHGDESPEYCASVGHPYMKALRATNRDQIKVEAQSFESAQAILVDTATDGQFGGTGKTFDWSMLPDLGKPVVLAGGLDAANVGAAIAATNPYAVDVSGGVELSRGSVRHTEGQPQRALRARAGRKVPGKLLTGLRRDE